MRLFHALVLVTLVTLASAQVQNRRFIRPEKVKLAVEPAVFVESPVMDAVADGSLTTAEIAVPKVQAPAVLPIYSRYWPDYTDYGWNAPWNGSPRYWRGSPNWYGWGGRLPYQRSKFVRPTVQETTTPVAAVAEEEAPAVSAVTGDV